MLGLLEDGDRDVRATAGLVLAVLVKDGAAALPAEAPARAAARIRAAIAAEADPAARLGQVLALGTAASRFPEARGWLRAIEAKADLGDPAGLAAALRLIDLGEPFDEADARPVRRPGGAARRGRLPDAAVVVAALVVRGAGFLRQRRDGRAAPLHPTRQEPPLAAVGRRGAGRDRTPGRAGRRHPADRRPSERA